MMSDWQYWKKWRDFVLPLSLDHKNDNKAQNREKEQDQLFKKSFFLRLDWCKCKWKFSPRRDETVYGINNVSKLSPSYSNQIRVFISLDARINLKNDRKKTFQLKLYVTTVLKIYMQYTCTSTFNYNFIHQKTTTTLPVFHRVFKFKPYNSESFPVSGTQWRGFDVWNLKHSKGCYFVIYKLREEKLGWEQWFPPRLIKSFSG